MNSRFNDIVNKLDQKLADLLDSNALVPGKLPRDLPVAGIYLFTEMGRHLYVGRSNDLRSRIQTHIRNSSQTNQAAFAYRLAREIVGIKKVSYKRLEPEEDWSLQEPFVSAFPASKKRIQKMDLRVVEESDPLSQVILEVYIAVELRTPYNDFDNH
jgi:hypothetical protein